MESRVPQIQNDIAGLNVVLNLLNESMRTADARGKMVIAANVADASMQQSESWQLAWKSWNGVDSKAGLNAATVMKGTAWRANVCGSGTRWPPPGGGVLRASWEECPI